MTFSDAVAVEVHLKRAAFWGICWLLYDLMDSDGFSESFDADITRFQVFLYIHDEISGNFYLSLY